MQICRVIVTLAVLCTGGTAWAVGESSDVYFSSDSVRIAQAENRARSEDPGSITRGDIMQLKESVDLMRENIRRLEDRQDAQGREFRMALAEQGREFRAALVAQEERMQKRLDQVQGTLDAVWAVLVGGFVIIIATLLGIIFNQLRGKAPTVVNELSRSPADRLKRSMLMSESGTSRSQLSPNTTDTAVTG